MKKTMLIEITNTVEDAADKTFKVIQGSHSKIANNYLSLKAYAVTAAPKISEYVLKGKGKNLSSLDDLLTNIASLSAVKPTMEEGVSPSAEIPAIFSGGKVKIDNSIRKINGLESLAVRMPHYEGTLAKLTAELSGKIKKAKAGVYAKPPEWSGD